MAALTLFSRGRGRGHALADMLILGRLAELGIADVDVVSYAEGAQAFRHAGWNVDDLGLPERPPSALAFAGIAEAIRRLRPAAVLAHEEFSAPAAARLFRVPTLFLTDWFSQPDDPAMRALDFAEEVVFLDLDGIFPTPNYLRGKTSCVGPALDLSQVGQTAWTAARARLGIPAADFVLGVFIHPGRRIERVAPCFELVADAVALKSAAAKRLVFLTSEEDAEIEALAATREGIAVLHPDTPLDLVAAACDIAVTKGNRNIALELAVRGVPTINLSFGLNAIDDHRTRHIPGQRTLEASEANPQHLAEAFEELLRSPRGPLHVPDGASAAASRINAFVRRVGAR